MKPLAARGVGRPVARRVRGALALLLALPFAPLAAARACTYDPLASSEPLTASGFMRFYRFTQSSPRWSAVAVRPAPGEDWDLALYASAAPEPGCVTGQLASSNAGAGQLDFVIADFSSTPLGAYQVAATRFAGTHDAWVEWNAGDDTLVSGPGTVHGHFTPSQLIRVHDVALEGGTTYLLDFLPQAGSGLHLSVFRNTLGGTFVVPRSFRQIDVTAATTWTPPDTGLYAMVVTNDAGADAFYTLGIGSPTCTPPATIASNTPVTFAGEGRFAFPAPGAGWSGLALRIGAGAWDVTLYDRPVGGAEPLCFDAPLANATFAPGGVDFALIDVGASRAGWYFATATPASGAPPATVEPLSPASALAINDDPRTFSLGAGEPAQLHTITLVAGHEYHVAFVPGDPGQKLLALRNPGAGPYVAGRAQAVLAVSGAVTFTPDLSGAYAFVVANDGGIPASYTLAIGDCAGYVTLASGVASTTSGRHGYARFTQTAATWAVVGVRKGGVDDDDLVVGQDPGAAGWPNCLVAGPVGASSVTPPRQDFVVGDFFANAPGAYSLHAYEVGGGPSPRSLEWEGAAQELTPNGNTLVQWATGGADFVRAYDVFLTAGRRYQLSFLHPGSADLHLCLFRNPGAGAYWAGRDAALFETAAFADFVAPATGYYGTVLVNDSGDFDMVFPLVTTCDPVLALAAGGATEVTAVPPSTFVSFTQAQPFWSALAVRSAGLSDQWELSAWADSSGGEPGTCFASLLAAAMLGGGVTDVLAGDFNKVPTGTYYGLVRRTVGTGTGHASFFPGSQVLPMNGPPVARLWHDDNLLELWDVALDAGTTYTISFTHDPAIDAHVVVFPAVPDEGWKGRLEADADESGSFELYAGRTGWHGIAVVNDGGVGNFTLAIYAGPLAVGAASRPAFDAFSALSPNPGRGRFRLDYALHDGARVTFELIDMAGRIVSRVEPGERGVGRWSTEWAPRDAGGRRLAAGVYLVRMRAGERTIGRRKLALLE